MSNEQRYQIDGEADGFIFRYADGTGEDVEGHRMVAYDEEPADGFRTGEKPGVEGYRVRYADTDEDVEGHVFW